MTTGNGAAGCDGCTLCCKVLEIDEIGKAEDAWCRDCDRERGCRVYADRPGPCQAFACLWLRSQAADGCPPLPADLRPDRCHAVLADPLASGVVQAAVDPDHPDAWRVGPLGALLQDLSLQGQTVVVFATGRRWTLVHGNAYELRADAGYLDRKGPIARPELARDVLPYA